MEAQLSGAAIQLIMESGMAPSKTETKSSFPTRGEPKVTAFFNERPGGTVIPPSKVVGVEGSAGTTRRVAFHAHCVDIVSAG